MESGEVKHHQPPLTPKKGKHHQPPVTPKKGKRPKPEMSAQANGGSSSSAAESSPLSRMSSLSPPSNDNDGKGQQQQHHQQGGGGKRPRLVWTDEPLSRTSSLSPPSNDNDGKGQQQHHQQGGGGKRPRLVWTDELHDLFVQAYDSLGDEAVPRRILEKMNEKMNVPEVSREKVASHLQKHKLHLRRLAEQASSHSCTQEAPAASHPPCPLPLNTIPLAEVPQAQLELVHVLQEPPDCLSRSSSSIAGNVQIIQSIQQQLLGPMQRAPAETMQVIIQAQPAETMQRAPADSGLSLVGMETSTAAILVPVANDTEAVIRMAENAAAEPEAGLAPGILAQFWASPDSEASTSSWDIFGLTRRT